MIFDWDDFHEGNHRLDLLQRLKDTNPAFRCTLFAVPALGSQGFWDTVPGWCELAVHGWSHPHPREAEHWDYRTAANVLASVPGRFAHGFKAPGWQISDATYQALIDHGWWCADHPDNTHRRPPGLACHVVGGPGHWHGHIQNVCGNGLEETFDQLLDLVAATDSFELVSEAATRWAVAA